MSARRYETRNLQLRVDDETPISDTPIMIYLGNHGFIEMSIEEGEGLLAGLTRALEDARNWRKMENR